MQMAPHIRPWGVKGATFALAGLALLASPGCVSPDLIREVNAGWQPFIDRGKRLVTPAMVDECRERIFTLTKEREEISPLEANLDLNKFISTHRYPFIQAKEDVDLRDIFLLVGVFKYQNWGFPARGRWGCTWRMRGESVAFRDVVSPADFKVNVYIRV